MNEEPYHVCLICNARFFFEFVLKAHYEQEHKIIHKLNPKQLELYSRFMMRT